MRCSEPALTYAIVCHEQIDADSKKAISSQECRVPCSSESTAVLPTQRRCLHRRSTCPVRTRRGALGCDNHSNDLHIVSTIRMTPIVREPWTEHGRCESLARSPAPPRPSKNIKLLSKLGRTGRWRRGPRDDDVLFTAHVPLKRLADPHGEESD